MALDRALSQEEIDNVFRNLRDAGNSEQASRKAQSYDFRRPDRIAKDQLRAIHLLHENFARTLASSLSAYLRAYVIVNLVSVEQLSFMEFTQCLPSPTVISALAMKPYEGSAVMELNPGLVFPMVEILLGGAGKGAVAKVDREVTEIEQSVLEGVHRIILHDMRDAWMPITSFDLEIGTTETEPQMLQLLAPSEAVVAISMEVRLGDCVGMMNIGIPSIIIKMLRQRFDQQWSMRKTESSEAEQERILRLIGPSQVRLEARLEGPSIVVQDFLSLSVGQVLRLDYPVDRPLHLEMNGVDKFHGHVVDTGRGRGFRMGSRITKATATEVAEEVVPR